VRVDQIDRSSETPLAVWLEICGVRVDLSTNDPAIIDRLRNLFPPSTPSEQSGGISSWRIVVEEVEDSSEWCERPSVHSLRDNGMAFIAIGQRSFLAYDFEARQGVSFCSANLVRDAALFTHYFVPALTAMQEEIRKAA
jgi:hypothetical protein